MTTRCGVAGSPIAHSLSPVLHRAAYAHLGLDWCYDRHEVGERDLAAFLDGLDASWRGLSLTMPLKHEALRLATTRSALADRVGAANTLVFGTAGERSADNTDVPGLVAALAERGVTAVPRAAVLGGGATACSALAALAGVAGGVMVVVRSRARAGEVLEVAARFEVPIEVLAWERADVALAAPLVVSTVPAGAADALAAAVPRAPGVLFDVLYEPWPTPLAAAWAAGGGAVLGGLDLLVHQAALQVGLMTGHGVPVEVLRAALRRGGPPVGGGA